LKKWLKYPQIKLNFYKNGKTQIFTVCFLSKRSKFEIFQNKELFTGLNFIDKLKTYPQIIIIAKSLIKNNSYPYSAIPQHSFKKVSARLSF